MNKFGRKNLDMLRSDIEKALAAVAEKRGVTFKTGRIRYTDGEFDMNLNCVIDGVKTKNQKNLEIMVEQFNLQLDGIAGRKLVEYKSRNHKYPFIFEFEGKRYKCSRDQAKYYFSKGPEVL